MIEREETRIYRKRYIQTQVEKTGTNKISAVFPERETSISRYYKKDNASKYL